MSYLTRFLRESLFYGLNQVGGKLDCNEMAFQAEQKTKLRDWGGLEFSESFSLLVESLLREARLSQRGRFVVVQHFTRLLCNILKIVDDWKRYPEIADVSIQDPIFILGFPRTGTTYLHSLIAQDPAFRSLRYWELLFPSPPPDPLRMERDSRIKKARQFVWGIDWISPKLATIHELKAEGVEECCFIFDHFFLDSIHHLVFDVPTYIQYYDRHDPLASYRFHRRMLQYYAWKFSFERFALKAPRHLYCLEALLRVYPNARIVWTHRDPKSALPSLCSLSETARRIVSDDIDRQRIGQLCLNHIVKDFHAGDRARKNADPRQFFDMSYRELIHDPVETVRKIYDHFGFSYTHFFDFRLRQSCERTKKNPPPLHSYSMDQYGLKKGEIEEQLKGYYERYGRYFLSA